MVWFSLLMAWRLFYPSLTFSKVFEKICTTFPLLHSFPQTTGGKYNWQFTPKLLSEGWGKKVSIKRRKCFLLIHFVKLRWQLSKIILKQSGVQSGAGKKTLWQQSTDSLGLYEWTTAELLPVKLAHPHWQDQWRIKATLSFWCRSNSESYRISLSDHKHAHDKHLILQHCHKSKQLSFNLPHHDNWDSTVLVHKPISWWLWNIYEHFLTITRSFYKQTARLLVQRKCEL